MTDNQISVFIFKFEQEWECNDSDTPIYSIVIHSTNESLVIATFVDTVYALFVQRQQPSFVPIKAPGLLCRF